MIENSKENNNKEWLLFYILLNERGFVSQLSGTPLEGKINNRWFYLLTQKVNTQNLDIAQQYSNNNRRRKTRN